MAKDGLILLIMHVKNKSVGVDRPPFFCPEIHVRHTISDEPVQPAWDCCQQSAEHKGIAKTQKHRSDSRAEGSFGAKDQR